jgi:hypothetical protein
MTNSTSAPAPATDRLTDHNMSKWSADLVRVLGNTWRMIQRRNPDVPDVVITIGIGRSRKSLTLGHFAQSAWQNGNGRAHELMIGAEGLARGAEEVITTLLHEATHGMARTRIERAKAAGDANAEKALNDTSRQGRWHNARFRELAIEIGLGYDYGQDENGCACKPDGYKLLGWAAAKLTPETAERYKVQIEQLRGALIAHRVGYVPAGGGDGEGDDADKVSGTVSASCECAPKPRKIRVSRSTLITDPIICGACGEEFRDRG